MTQTPLFQKDIPNALAIFTDWTEHQILLIGVYRRYRFNGIEVAGLIEIQQLEREDVDALQDDPQTDFRDNMTSYRIQTTSGSARDLAQLLLEAADAADAADTKSGGESQQ